MIRYVSRRKTLPCKLFSWVAVEVKIQRQDHWDIFHPLSNSLLSRNKCQWGTVLKGATQTLLGRKIDIYTFMSHENIKCYDKSISSNLPKSTSIKSVRTHSSSRCCQCRRYGSPFVKIRVNYHLSSHEQRAAK